MAIIKCPECEGQMRFPDDSPPRKVKCPGCAHIFMSDGSTPSTTKVPALPKGRGSKADINPDEDEDDRPRTRRREDEDEDDRPRARRRDRDRDDDDRPKKKGKKKAGTNFAGIMLLLFIIAGWVTVGANGLWFFISTAIWLGMTEGINFFVAIIGVVSALAWVTYLVGAGLSIAGVKERGALGFSIALTGTSLLHLILMIVVATTRSRYIMGMSLSGDVNWVSFTTQLFVIPNAMSLVLNGMGRFAIPDYVIFGVLANLAELARAVLLLLYVRVLATLSKERVIAKWCMRGVIGVGIFFGVTLLLGIFVGLVMLAFDKDFKAFQNIYGAFNTINVLLTIGFYAGLAVLAKKGRECSDFA